MFDRIAQWQPDQGADAAARAVAALALVTLAVIHVVDGEYDHGPVIARLAVPIEAGDTAETLESRVKGLEPGFYIETLRRIALGDLKMP